MRARPPKAACTLQLACDLQRAVAVVGNLLGVREWRGTSGRCFRGALLDVVGVDRERGHERVVAGFDARQPHALLHDTGHVTAGVERGIPSATLQGREATVAITVHVLDVREAVTRLRPAAVEDRDLVAPFDGMLDRMPPDEMCSADHEKLHVFAVPPDGGRTLQRQP